MHKHLIVEYVLLIENITILILLDYLLNLEGVYIASFKNKDITRLQRKSIYGCSPFET